MNLWVRANMEQFDPATLALVPASQRDEYARVMANLAEAKSQADAALGLLRDREMERAAFFDRLIWQVEAQAQAQAQAAQVAA